MARLSLRIDLDPAGRFGPGKARLLDAVRETGSISAAGRMLGMSYRRAWMLTEEMNGFFTEPLVVAQSGGRAGGGAALTPLGETVLGHYRAIEEAAARIAAPHLSAIQQATARRDA